jgi:hypothetical protein
VKNLAVGHTKHDWLFGNKLDGNFHQLPSGGCRRIRRSTFGQVNGFRHVAHPCNELKLLA